MSEALARRSGMESVAVQLFTQPLARLRCPVDPRPPNLAHSLWCILPFPLAADATGRPDRLPVVRVSIPHGCRCKSVACRTIGPRRHCRRQHRDRYCSGFHPCVRILSMDRAPMRQTAGDLIIGTTVAALRRHAGCSIRGIGDTGS